MSVFCWSSSGHWMWEESWLWMVITSNDLSRSIFQSHGNYFVYSHIAISVPTSNASVLWEFELSIEHEGGVSFPCMPYTPGLGGESGHCMHPVPVLLEITESNQIRSLCQTGSLLHVLLPANYTIVSSSHMTNSIVTAHACPQSMHNGHQTPFLLHSWVGSKNKSWLTIL